MTMYDARRLLTSVCCCHGRRRGSRASLAVTILVVQQKRETLGSAVLAATAEVVRGREDQNSEDGLAEERAEVA